MQMKLMSYINEANRTAANAWIDTNLGAGPNTYAAMNTKNGEEGLYFLSDWLCDSTTADAVANYLSSNFPNDSGSEYYDNDIVGKAEEIKAGWGLVPYEV